MTKKFFQKLYEATDTIWELFLLYFAILVVAAGAYSFFEHKSFLDALWWACVTGMTVGYGDMYPVTTGGRVVAVVLMHATVLFILPLLISRMATTLIKNNDAWTDEEQEKVKNDLKAIKAHFGIE